MARVELRSLSKHFGSVEAVHEVDLVCEDREFMVLVGPSGCGKSTVLRMIAGLEDPTAGDILIDGEPVNHLPPKDRDVAMVFQNYALYPHMTVFKNMAFGLRLRRFPKHEIRQRVDETARILGLTDVLDRKPAALSGGQRQRVAVGRAIVREPRVFLFDEPLSNLDARLRNQTRAELAQLHRRLQATIIYVTHDQVEAMTMGDRIAAIEGGRLQQIDRPMELYARPRNLFVAGFIGSPAMNFFEGTVDDGHFVCGELRFELPAAVRAAAAAAAARDVTFGIRPEALLLDAGRGARARVRGRTELIEPLGAETFAHVRAGDRLLAARLAADTGVATDEQVELHFDPAAGHYFSSATGERLGGE